MVNFDNFQWINRGDVRVDGDRIVMTAPALTDFFCGGETSSEEGILPESLCNAPYYHTEIEGDFVLQVKVSHAFRETYDSASIMIMQDMTNWAKCCFELTDFGTHAAVSVVTKNGESDDANGCDIEGQDYLWLRVCRVGRAFSFHYSKDGEHFHMTRYAQAAALSVSYSPSTLVIVPHALQCHKPSSNVAHALLPLHGSSQF